MKPLDQYPVQELKDIYILLHAQLPHNMELMDSELLQDLQTLLQRHARTEGIDVTLHAQWAAWLNHGSPRPRG